MNYKVNIINFDDDRDFTTVGIFANKWAAVKFVEATIERYFDDGFDVIIEEI